MNFDFEISRVDCISKENYNNHFNIKTVTSHSLEPPSPSLTFSAIKTFKCKTKQFEQAEIEFPNFAFSEIIDAAKYGCVRVN